MNGETVIDLTLQRGNPARPLTDVWIPAGSAAAFRIRGIDADSAASVSVSAVNADGMALTVDVERDGCDLIAVFPAIHFARYGAVENGLRISITRDGMEFLVAVGSLMIENVDGTAQAGDPSANVVTKDQLVALFDGLELADTATQKEVRTALQQVISKFKGLVAPAVAVAAMAASAAVTPHTAWEDVPPQDSVSSVAAAAGLATTNDVCNIVTNEVQSFGDWVEEWDPPYYGTVYSFSGPYYEGGETWSGFYHPKKGMGVDMSFTAAGGEFATRLVFVEDLGETSFTLTLTRSHATENVLGLARMSDLLAHTNRTDNPHRVTAAQVGAYTKAEVDAKVENAVLPTDPAFSNAVLAVGLNIDTNSVAVLGEIASTFGGFPIEGTATTVGGLLAALAAAIAWLKKNKVGSFESVGGASATVENGVAKLSDFFTESNSLLNGRLAYSRNATGIKDRAFNTLSFDGTEFDLSAALEAVTPTASGQPRDLLIVATATAATTISFTAGTIKGDKPTIDGSGTWLITLTEYASGVWYCRQIKMEDAA